MNKSLVLSKGIRFFRKFLFYSLPVTTTYLFCDTVSRMYDRSIFKEPIPMQMFHIAQFVLPYVIERRFRASLRKLETILDSGFIDAVIVHTMRSLIDVRHALNSGLFQGRNYDTALGAKNVAPIKIHTDE